MTETGPDVAVVGRLAQEFLIHEDIEQGVAGVAVEPPEALELPLGQVQPRNLGKLATDNLQPIRDRCLGW